MAQMKNMGEKLKTVDDKTLIKLFLISGIALTAQSIISQKTRRWLLNTMLIMVYLSLIGVSTSSLTMIVFKKI